MATTTGTSTKGLQLLADFRTLTVPQFEVIFPATPILPFARVGFAYVFVLNQVTPFQTRLLDSRPMYRPGIFIPFPNNYGFSAVRYSLQVKWDVPGLNWTCTFN